MKDKLDMDTKKKRMRNTSDRWLDIDSQTTRQAARWTDRQADRSNTKPACFPKG